MGWLGVGCSSKVCFRQESTETLLFAISPISRRLPVATWGQICGHILAQTVHFHQHLHGGQTALTTHSSLLFCTIVLELCAVLVNQIPHRHWPGHLGSESLRTYACFARICFALLAISCLWRIALWGDHHRSFRGPPVIGVATCIRCCICAAASIVCMLLRTSTRHVLSNWLNPIESCRDCKAAAGCVLLACEGRDSGVCI
jgi:hypothetical protein